MNDIYIESKIDGEKRAFISPRTAAKFGLMNDNFKRIEVNGLIIPIQKLTKQDLKKKVAK